MSYTADATNASLPPDYGWLLSYAPAELRAIKNRINSISVASAITGIPRASTYPMWNNSNIDMWGVGNPLRYINGVGTSKGYYTSGLTPLPWAGYTPAGLTGYSFMFNSASYGTELHSCPKGYGNLGSFDTVFGGIQAQSAGASYSGEDAGCFISSKFYLWEMQDNTILSGTTIPFVHPGVPQVGPVYRPCQSWLDMQNTFGYANPSPIDVFGNYWTVVGTNPNLQTASGFYALGGSGGNNDLNGSEGIKTTYITSLQPIGNKGWSVAIVFYPGSLPSASANAYIWQASNSSGYGATLSIYNNAGAYHLAVSLSSNGSSNDIASNVQGTTIVDNSKIWYALLTFDEVAGNYKVYLGGVSSIVGGLGNMNIPLNSTAEITVASALPVCQTAAGMFIGTPKSGSSGLVGKIGVFSFNPFSVSPGYLAAMTAIDTRTLSSAQNPDFRGSWASNSATIPACPWFDTNCGKWRWPSGVKNINVPLGFPDFSDSPTLYMVNNNPTLVQFTNQKLVGEFTCTDKTTVANMINYAYKNKYQSLPTAISNSMTFSHNMGARPVKVTCWLENLQAEAGYSPGDRVFMASLDNATNVFSVSTSGVNNIIVAMTSTTPAIAHQSSGARTGITAAKWAVVVYAESGIS